MEVIPKADVINQLLSLHVDPSLVAQILRIDISEVRRHGGFSEVIDTDLARGVATLFNKALVRANFDLDFAHPEFQQQILQTLLSNVAKRYSGNTHDEASEVRVSLERLLTGETDRGPAYLELDPEAPDADDQEQGREVGED